MSLFSINFIPISISSESDTMLRNFTTGTEVYHPLVEFESNPGASETQSSEKSRIIELFAFCFSLSVFAHFLSISWRANERRKMIISQIKTDAKANGSENQIRNKFDLQQIPTRKGGENGEQMK